MQLLMTRPRPQAQNLTPLLQAQGHRVLLLPLLDIIFDKTAALPAAASPLAFTSANGVRAFAAAAPHHRADKKRCIFTIGAQSHACALENISALCASPDTLFRCPPEQSDIKGLADLIIAHRQKINLPLAHIVGRHQAGDLVAALAQAGIAAQKYVLYEARPTIFNDDNIDSTIATTIIKEDIKKGVLLYSRRSADLFLAYWQKHIAPLSPDLHKNYTAFCLSQPLGDYMRPYGFPALAPCVPTQTAMLDLLAKEAHKT